MSITMRNRRIKSFRRRAKDQRMKLYIVLAAIAILFCFSLAPVADTGVHEITVIADTGDTLLSICEPYCPEDMSLRLFVDKVYCLNDLDTSCLSIGQEIIIPIN